METDKLRKSKIEFISEEGKLLKKDFFENLLKNENLSLDEKWFLRGCKHITERHYTEAIKRFQLSNSDDAKILLLSCCFKIADKFLFDEYYTENLKSFKYFPKYRFYPYFIVEREKKKIDMEFVKDLKDKF